MQCLCFWIQNKAEQAFCLEWNWGGLFLIINHFVLDFVAGVPESFHDYFWHVCRSHDRWSLFPGLWWVASHSKLRHRHLVLRGQNCRWRPAHLLLLLLSCSLHPPTDLQWALCVRDAIWPSGTHFVWKRKPLKCLWLRIKVPRYEGCRRRSQVSREDVESTEERKSLSNNCQGHS